MACATGWTWEYIDTCVTLPRLAGFAEYWKESPPVNELMAAWVGVSGDAKHEDTPDLLTLFPRMG